MCLKPFIIIFIILYFRTFLCIADKQPEQIYSDVIDSGPLNNDKPIDESLKNIKPLPMPTIDENRMPSQPENRTVIDADRERIQGGSAYNPNKK